MAEEENGAELSTLCTAGLEMPPDQPVRCAAVTTGVISDVWTWVYNAARWTWHDPDGYNFISGPLADVTLLAGGYAIARRHNCHVRRCWRIGRAPVPGTDYIVCRKHHPHDAPSAEKVLAAHNTAMAQRHAAAPDQTAGARES